MDNQVHWAESWLGWADGDCADLVRAVMLERFGLAVPLPSAREAGVRGRDGQIAAAAEALAQPVDAPLEGDVVVMRAAGRQRSLGHHVGVFCDVGGEPHVLHRLAGAGACLHRLDGLRTAGLEATGIYRWR